MKTFKNLLLVVLVSTLTISAYAAMVSPATPVTESAVVNSDNLVRAVFSNGEWMPVVDLPEVEIIGSHISPSVYKGVFNDGEIMASVELAVVEIIAIRIQELPATIINEASFEAIYDLPVIEIVASFPEEKLVRGEHKGSDYLAVVDLPEVIISVNQFDFESLVNHVSFLSVERNNQRSVETSSSSSILINLVQNNISEKNYKYYSISLDNCIITEHSQKICEFILRMGSSAMSGINKNLIGVVQP